MKYILLLILMLAPTFNLSANQSHSIANFLDEHLSTMNSASNEFLSTQKIAPYGFKNFLLRVQGSFGLDIPFFASAKIVPEVELVWSKVAE